MLPCRLRDPTCLYALWLHIRRHPGLCSGCKYIPFHLICVVGTVLRLELTHCWASLCAVAWPAAYTGWPLPNEITAQHSGIAPTASLPPGRARRTYRVSYSEESPLWLYLVSRDQTSISQIRDTEHSCTLSESRARCWCVVQRRWPATICAGCRSAREHPLPTAHSYSILLQLYARMTRKRCLPRQGVATLRDPLRKQGAPE